MKKLTMWHILLLLSILVPVAANTEPLRIFVSVLPQKTFVERIGGPHVAVQVMVGPGHNPGTYSPTPRQVAALAGTDLYIRTGVPFEDAWMERIRAINPDLLVLDARSGIDLRATGHHDDGVGQDDHDDRGIGQNTLDPHVWTSPPLVKQMSGSIRDTLTNLDPTNAQVYADNFAAFAAELDALDQNIRVLLKDLSNRRFMVFHPAWGYFADAYGLIEVPIEKEGKVPGARAMAALIEQAKREQIKVIFVQPQFDKRAASRVASAIGGRVVAIDPLAADFAANLLQVAGTIAATARP